MDAQNRDQRKGPGILAALSAQPTEYPNNTPTRTHVLGMIEAGQPLEQFKLSNSPIEVGERAVILFPGGESEASVSRRLQNLEVNAGLSTAAVPDSFKSYQEARVA